MSYSGLSKVTSLIDLITAYIGKTIAWLTLVMVILSFTIVALRYGAGIGWIAMQESVLYMHGIVIMLGAGYTLKADGHVRVDIFYQKFNQVQKAWVNLLGTLCFLLPVCIAVFFLSFGYVHTSWQIMEKSVEAGGLPLVYLNKSLILLLCITLALQGLAEIFRNIDTILAGNKEEG